jgi:hypothetical protein
MRRGGFEMNCQNCRHEIIYSEEYDFWMHKEERVTWVKDEEYDFCKEDSLCAVLLPNKNYPTGKLCGCTNPQPDEVEKHV